MVNGMERLRALRLRKIGSGDYRWKGRVVNVVAIKGNRE